MVYQDIECYGVVYRLIAPSGKSYVGQTTDLTTRWASYRRMDCKGQPKLYKALCKYGVEAFTFEVIYVAYDKAQLDWLEAWFIEEYHTMSDGYNCMSGGAYGKHSEETKLKIGQACTNPPAERRARMSLAQSKRRHTPEDRRKMRAYQLGRKFTPEHRANISRAAKGRKVSLETRAKLSLAASSMSVDTKARISNALQGHSVSAETRERMCRTHTGKPHPTVIGALNPKARAVLCITTGIKYDCILDAARAVGVNRSGICMCCAGRQSYAGKLADGTKLAWQYGPANVGPAQPTCVN